MLRPAISIALAVTALAASPVAAAPAPLTSWGRAGVSFDDYRGDATACLREAAATDLTGTEPAEMLVLASRRIETALGTDIFAVEQAKMAARPELRLQQAREILQSRLDECLGARGYHRFRLSEDQRQRLRHLSLSGDERQLYMHSLASDPRVLASQGIQPATQ